MALQQRKVRTLLALFMLGLASIPAFGGSSVVGAVVAAKNASVGGVALMPGHTIFSGDGLRVEYGMTLLTMGKGSRMVFGRHTVASFERESNEVTALLDRGSVSVYHAMDDLVALRLEVGNLSIMPAEGFGTLGDVAVTDEGVVIKTALGLLRVEAEGTGQAFEVPKGETVKFVPNLNKTAAAPQQQGGAQPHGRRKRGGFFWLPVGAAAAGGILAAVAVSNAGGANDAANKARADAAGAAADANGAANTANTAAQNAINFNCAVQKISDSLLGNPPEASESEPSIPGCNDDAP
jgi:hypothetical protein